MEIQEIWIDNQNHASSIRDFESSLGLQDIAPGRYSKCLLIEMYVEAVIRERIEPSRIIKEIAHLEGMCQSRTKPEQPFKKPMLLGLMHKHYQYPGISSLSANLLNESKRQRSRMEAIYNDLIDHAGDTPEDDWAIAGRMAHEFARVNWIRRSEDQRLTGEWIIFTRHQCENFYLSLGKHSKEHDADEKLRSKIINTCLPEFPFLREVMSIHEDEIL